MTNANMIRACAMRRPMKPFILFCTKQELHRVLEGTGIDLDQVVAHGREIKPGLGLWYFTVATSYSGTEHRTALGLVSIKEASK